MPDRPNILYIMTDQQSASAMSCAGNPDVKTPAMDSLAEQGVRFDRAYCSFPLCLPARTSMVTGRMPHEFGIHGNGGQLSDEDLDQTLFHVLGRAGYECAYAGKTHMPVDPKRGYAASYGYEEIAPFADPPIAPACNAFLKRDHDRPFFLVASYDDPHNICEWARQQQLPYGNIPTVATEDCPNLPANFAIPPFEPVCIRESMRSSPQVNPLMEAEPEHWRQYRHAYFRLVERVDRQIGEILDTLHATGHADDTIVIFASDHGDGHGAHQINQKTFFYDEISRVPLIIRPAGGGESRTSDALASSSLDLLPTVYDYAGIDIPENVRGRSLRPIVEGDTPSDWREAVFSETNLYCAGEGRMVRTSRYKYSTYFWGRYREVLTDMENDPGEMVNLAVERQYEPVLAEHRKLLRDWCELTGEQLNPRWGIQ